MNTIEHRVVDKEAWDGLADTAPFVFSIFISFLLFGIIGQKKGFDGLALCLITGSMMSEPLQLTLLNAPVESLSLTGVAVSALSANLRFVIFTISIRRQLAGSLARHVPALAVMANAAYTLISLRQQSQVVSVKYTNAVCFSLYGAALTGTVVGYAAGLHLGSHMTEHATAALAIFICSQLGKMSSSRNLLYTMLFVGFTGMCQLWLFGGISLMFSFLGAVAFTYIYDRA
ncbi:AzlC family ABC transporter permease [Xylophilus ampelinus]|uniref:Putative branched-subunit amino acid permease n=1 Tax=Xylophilus ampelinus TaxID=54067 RepID=A0A318SJY2_9BURK|nr:AzlC family ABC transporter permease [Xylophilus ampelinus]MCS4510902.1 AzlC family ABC transporter permease [Xylophilus ampelinus]PYE76061.1 putative branched-subunit amino acid permease [Xylophilus ampelinus]